LWLQPHGVRREAYLGSAIARRSCCASSAQVSSQTIELDRDELIGLVAK
jgi:hypothetical protein